MEVKFLNHNDGTKEIELCEITYPDGRVNAFPANEVIAGRQNLTFAQAYPAEYAVLKASRPPVQTAAKPMVREAVKAKAKKPQRRAARKSK